MLTDAGSDMGAKAPWQKYEKQNRRQHITSALSYHELNSEIYINVLIKLNVYLNVSQFPQKIVVMSYVNIVP